MHFTELAGMDELYDQSDPGEMKNLIFDAAIAAGAYTRRTQEDFAFDPRLHTARP